MNTYVAHTIKGLEFITEMELTDKFQYLQILSNEPKKIIFESDYTPQSSNLRTFDDLSLLATQTEFRDESEVISLIESIDLEKVREIISQHRTLNNSFSITVSTYKNKKIDKKILKTKIAEKITSKYLWEYTPLSHENFDIRIQIENNKVLILIKYFPKSLFFRDYRIQSQKGAIRPSIAGAMLYYLSKGKKGHKIVDNFCGSGTFLCEALMDGNKVYGGDISEESVNVASYNLKTISKTFSIKKINAKTTNWADNMFDIAISNLPWDQQISVDHFTQLYAESILEYGRILKPNGAIGLIGSKPDLMIKYIKKIFPDRKDANIKVVTIGYLGQTPSIVFCS